MNAVDISYALAFRITTAITDEGILMGVSYTEQFSRPAFVPRARKAPAHLCLPRLSPRNAKQQLEVSSSYVNA